MTGRPGDSHGATRAPRSGDQDREPPDDSSTFPSFPCSGDLEPRSLTSSRLSPNFLRSLAESARTLTFRDERPARVRKGSSHAPFTSRAARVGRRRHRHAGHRSHRQRRSRLVAPPRPRSRPRGRGRARNPRSSPRHERRRRRSAGGTAPVDDRRRCGAIPSTAVGRIVAVALLRDDVVGARHLVAGVNGIVPVGRRAVHVVVKDGFQPPLGSVVDVLATFDPSSTGAGTPGRATIVAHGAVG